MGVYPWRKHDVYPAKVGNNTTSIYFDYVRMTYAITLLNHPSMLIPCGVDDRGLPFGLQVVVAGGI